MLKGFNSIGDVQVYWHISEETYLQSLHKQDYQDLVEPLAKLYSYVIEYQARVICHLSRAQLSRAWQDVTGWNDWVGLAGEVTDLSKGCSDCIPPLREQELRRNRDSQLQEMQESRTILDKIRHILKEGRKQTQRIYEDQWERNLLRDLASDYEGYKNFNPQRVAGTCEWFFDDDRFRRWRDSRISSLLWVSAGPGCGKSVLSRALIDEERLSTNVTTSTVCHLFFKDGDERRMDSTNALCAILHQLFTQDPTGSLMEHALPSFKNKSEKLMVSFSELWRILENCARSSNTGEIVCILDALDECNKDSRRQLINQLKEFYTKQDQSRSHPSKLKFLITSRPYDDLEASFRKFSGTTTYMRFDGDDRSDQIGREINLVIDARMHDIGGDLADEDRRTISERLKCMENRTYLWLHLTFDIIEQSPSEYSRRSDMETLLSDLPSQVSEAYEKILSRSKDSLQADMLLQIVLAAAEPLTLDEANVALTSALERQWHTSFVEFAKKKWHPKSFQTVVKNLCGLLINVYDSKLFLLHQTAREFLTAEPDPQYKWKGRFNMRQSHGTLSLSCLNYLSLSDIATAVQDNSIDDQQYPFISYATANWLFHYTESKILLDLEACHNFLSDLSETSKKAPRSQELNRFKDSQTKIAIIGNGVDTTSSTVKTNNYVGGISYAGADGRIWPWYVGSDPYGTHAVSLIQKVNPFCRLYIARVGEGREDILPENVAKVWIVKLGCLFLSSIAGYDVTFITNSGIIGQAVDWAINQKVDIISISRNTNTDDNRLREAIRKAVNAAANSQTSPILVFCPAADEGMEEGMMFPAGYENTIRVAANNMCGHLRPTSQNGVDILVPGEDIEAGAPLYMKRYVSESMSSVAPALAAGIASLVLLLLRIYNDDQAALKEFLQKHKIMQVFARMGSGQGGIQLSQLFGDFCGDDDIASRWATANFA